MPDTNTQKNNATEVKKNLEDLKTTMEGFHFSSQEADETHETLLQALENLVQETDHFYKKENGAYPPMTEEAFNHFAFLYQDLLNSIGEYRDVMSRQTGKDKELGTAMVQVLSSVEELLYKDVLTLSSAPAKGLTTLPDIVEHSRTRTVDITGQNLSSSGFNLSTRLKITVPGQNGDPNMTGFFTEASSTEEKEECDAITRRWLQKNPQIQQVLDEIDEDNWNLLLDTLSPDNNFYHLTGSENKGNPSYLGPDYCLKKYLSLSEKEYKKMFVGTGLAQDFMEYANEYHKASYKYRLLELAGIDNNHDVARRNSAMSTVADLLGMGNLIARSESMTLTDGEKKLSGHFMESAKGTDLMTCQPGDPLLCSDTTVNLENNDLKKQLSDLQILDFICGNTDRHSANMLYKVEGTDPKHLTISGIQGIDNDCSFGNITDACMSLPQDGCFGVISESTARTISCLNENLLKTALRNYNFSDEEINAAWNRTKKIQDAIKEGEAFYQDKDPSLVQVGHLRTVKDSDWDRFSMKDLSGLYTSYFSTIMTLPDSAKEAYFLRECEQARKEYSSAFSEFYKHGKGLHSLNDLLKKEDKGLLTGSRQYDRVMEAASQLENLHAEVLKSKPYEEVRRLLDGYTQTLDAAKAYLNYKEAAFQRRIEGKSLAAQQKELLKFQDPNSRDFKRMSAVSQLIAQVEEYKKQGEQLLKTGTDYEAKRELTSNSQKQVEYLKDLENKAVKKDKDPKRVLMSKEELFDRPRSNSIAATGNKKSPAKEQEIPVKHAPVTQLRK